MITSLLESTEFQKLEKEYKFLSRAREKLDELPALPYIILDVETTGLDPQKHELTEIAALKIEKQEIVDVFNTLIKPKQKISYKITQLTGITEEMVSGQPSFSDIVPKFLQYVKGYNLVAHNAEFDLSFIRHHLSLNKKEINNPVLCSLKLSRFLLKTHNHKLHTVAGHFGITAQNRHRALGDVETLYQAWFKLLELAKTKNIYDLEELRKIC
ncbi:hypothetical protein A2276_03905 [candidate division WOR-1 bacterium RIFOXYA12_FULL_43_27]|uniref:Exonuclease domain-containing protein n=1 Tax=candidate division WOR-1 bacterium RIFOXYC2_FULL_46_14 TaxID=1802587 RepID=A0A1F4U8Y6_UNCSA|nr:MAG: hypothetical protein A2276_03905 [candidate division WOR-1 bacterium RIFOXYA12_FULL_43_27]OGC19162.1 MAG: hypothetical protein A2292_00430 [candidate division WOR-1 bacterium RIFOXYB2_FULL_46_45]OGC30151.1 MAG: hypothetical protein A2232_00430 [candidate division WOR-1 bacterium RIFOXYA2_FULL_46_56]OGC40753.1 MAG: hypothetical protein A2438_00435 [candidate division WOR-1 bacterium RIFOXYC2_FULL_46_14]